MCLFIVSKVEQLLPNISVIFHLFVYLSKRNACYDFVPSQHLPSIGNCFLWIHDKGTLLYHCFLTLIIDEMNSRQMYLFISLLLNVYYWWNMSSRQMYLFISLLLNLYHWWIMNSRQMYRFISLLLNLYYWWNMNSWRRYLFISLLLNLYYWWNESSCPCISCIVVSMARYS